MAGNLKITADWLGDPALAAVFAAIEQDGDEARIVGGPVRNALYGLPVNDIDIATTAAPRDVMARASSAGLKAVPTGIEHGTITVVSNGRPFEVTTLREDIETFGRHAKVQFGRSWEHDAQRRDFTMNALYASLDGTIYDPIGGLQDCLDRKVRFIGEPEQRITEDFLRILRFFRFHATYGHGQIDARGLASVIRLRDGLTSLSHERVGQEMRRLLMADKAAPTLDIMSEAGISQIVLGGVDLIPGFYRLVEIERLNGRDANLPVRLAVMAVLIEEDVVRLTQRLRLSNAERDRLNAIVTFAAHLTRSPDERALRTLLYRAGTTAYVGAVLFAWARDCRAVDDPRWQDVLSLPDRWQAPVFPVRGRDLIAAGVERGVRVGDTLAVLEAKWVRQGFKADRSEILSWVDHYLAE